MDNTEDKRVSVVNLRAVDQYAESNIVLPTEKANRGTDMIEWGEGNGYPEYLLDLYRNSATLKSIVDGNRDYIAGDDVDISVTLWGGAMNRKGETARDLVKSLAKDYEIYGGFALQVIRGFDGRVSELYRTDMRFLRTNKDRDVFWYSEKFGKRGKADTIVYPAFLANLDWAGLSPEERSRHASSILYVVDMAVDTYPSPLYAAAVKSCEIERSIDEYHLNAISNGFVSSAIVNFNNGVPDEKVMEEIEDTFNEKFSGKSNAGRILFCWNKDKESATEIITPSIEDFGDRYTALASTARQRIFTAFRANPNLFGIPTENLGFSQEEYDTAFKLYNRTQIRPVQRLITDAFDKVFGIVGVMQIKPFTLEGTDTIIR